jgi:hypothetical protein
MIMMKDQSQSKFSFYIDETISVAGPIKPHPFIKFLRQASQNADNFASVGGTNITLNLTDDMEQCDFCVLPFTWNQYLDSGSRDAVIAFADSARRINKHIIIWCTGDYEMVIPIVNSIQFQNGLHRTRKRAPEFSFEVPAFWPDYLAIYFGGQMKPRKKRDRPSVGFCGQATAPSFKIAFWTMRSITQRLGYLAGRASYVPQPVRQPVLLRKRVIEILSGNSFIDADFIIRDRYRAGIKSKADRSDPFHPTKVEFVNNISGNDYTVCVRGGGNFSVRLYETLSCGRIPIIVDTDCRLPYDFLLDWKQYCIWVDYRDVNQIADIVLDFHTSLSNEDFAELQVGCRQLWSEWLSSTGFFQHFVEHLLYVRRNDRSPIHVEA